MHTTETLPQTLRRCAREVFHALRAADRVSLRFGLNFGPQRVTIGSATTEETVGAAPDLPDVLWLARDATRDVYRALRDLRAERPADAVVMPADIKAAMEAGDVTPDAQSIHTINHALRDLLDKELAWSHPGRGWVLGCAQPRLPISGRQSDGPSGAAIDAYTARMADTGVRRFLRGDVPMQRVWVPGEQNEYGVVIVDIESERGVACTERIGEMQVPTRSGKLATVAAVRCDLVRAEGRLMVVRPPKGPTLTVRVLGDWQLAGRAAPDDAEVAEVAVRR